MARGRTAGEGNIEEWRKQPREGMVAKNGAGGDFCHLKSLVLCYQDQHQHRCHSYNREHRGRIRFWNVENSIVDDLTVEAERHHKKAKP